MQSLDSCFYVALQTDTILELDALLWNVERASILALPVRTSGTKVMHLHGKLTLTH